MKTNFMLYAHVPVGFELLIRHKPDLSEPARDSEVPARYKDFDYGHQLLDDLPEVNSWLRDLC